MALKDWEKLKTNKKVVLHAWRKNHYEVQIQKLPGIDYVVLITKYNNMIDKGHYFKTKSQALKYAKEYMRKH